MTRSTTTGASLAMGCSLAYCGQTRSVGGGAGIGVDDGALGSHAGMKNEFIIPREHRNEYDHAIRVAGAKLVDERFDGQRHE